MAIVHTQDQAAQPGHQSEYHIHFYICLRKYISGICISTHLHSYIHAHSYRHVHSHALTLTCAHMCALMHIHTKIISRQCHDTPEVEDYPKSKLFSCMVPGLHLHDKLDNTKINKSTQCGTSSTKSYSPHTLTHAHCTPTHKYKLIHMHIHTRQNLNISTTHLALKILINYLQLKKKEKMHQLSLKHSTLQVHMSNCHN